MTELKSINESKWGISFESNIIEAQVIFHLLHT